MAKVQSTNFDLHKRAMECIGQGYLTNSKRPECFIKGIYPTHLKRGVGCHVWDYQDKKYIDFITGLGTNLLGHNNQVINGAAIAGINNGNLFSLGSEEEIKLAEKLKEIFTWTSHWKLLKTGNEATLAAIKMARLKNARLDETSVLVEGFHGHGDPWCDVDERYHGIGDRFYFKKMLSLEDLEKEVYRKEVCSIIIEPIITDISEKRIAWLRELRELCTKYNIVLIFDEIVTGFRFPKYSASNYFGIEPDLIVTGKAMANGFSLAAVGGKREIMNGEYFVSSTYASSLDAIMASYRTIESLQKYYNLESLWDAGAHFIKEFNLMWPDKIWIEGYPTRGVFKGDELVKALLFQEACLAGILFGPSFFFNFPLMDVSFQVLNTVKDIIYKIQFGNVELKGEMPQAAIAQKVRS